MMNKTLRSMAISGALVATSIVGVGVATSGTASATGAALCSTASNAVCPLASSTQNFSINSYASNAIMRSYENRFSVEMYAGSMSKIQAKVGVAQDGVFGSGTRAKVMAWQRSHGLTADGVVGPATARAMGLSWVTNLSQY